MTVFRFHSVWTPPAPAARVYRVLADVHRYTEWWPQIRQVRTFDQESGEMIIRSVVPFSLTVVGRREIEDPDRLLLRVGLTGDMSGWSSWQIESSPTGCTATFTQQVSTTGWLRVASALAGPVFEWNHAVMMRNGERGLTTHLATDADVVIR